MNFDEDDDFIREVSVGGFVCAYKFWSTLLRDSAKYKTREEMVRHGNGILKMLGHLAQAERGDQLYRSDLEAEAFKFVKGL